jgi:hypothetical protein
MDKLVTFLPTGTSLFFKIFLFIAALPSLDIKNAHT